MMQECHLSDVLKLQRGHDLPSHARRSGNIPVLTSSGITGFHDEPKAKGPGVVTGRYGTLGEVFFVEEDFWPHNTTLYVVDFKGTNPRFAAYFLRNILSSYQSDKAAVPGIDRNVLHALKVRVPSGPAQERIAEVLSAYDELIDNNRRRMALLEQAARLLYQEWFVRLRFPGREQTRTVDGIPEEWSTRPLGRCADFLSGGTPNKARNDYWDGEIPWISSGEMTAPRISESSLRITAAGADAGSRIVPPNTILAVVRGMSLAKEFRVAITSATVTFNQDLKALVARDGIDPVYLFCALLEQKEQIRDRATEASHGTKKLDTAVLASIPILVPPVPIQQRFRQLIDPMNAQWDNLQRQNQELRAARDLLLPRLMSGEITV